MDVTESHIQHRRRMCLQLEQVSGRYVTARPRKGVASTDADFDSVVEKVRCETSFFLLRRFSSQSDKTSPTVGYFAGIMCHRHFARFGGEAKRDVAAPQEWGASARKEVPGAGSLALRTLVGAFQM